jgi:VanZ family protein
MGSSVIKFELGQPKRFFFYWGLVILYLGIIYYLSSLSLRNLKSPFPFFDKVFHAGEYAILAILLYRALYISLSKPLMRFIGIWVVFLCLIYGITDEFHQSFVPSRFPDFFDLIANTTGAILGTLVIGLFLSLKNKKQI